MNYYMYEFNCDVKIWNKQRKDRYLTNINDIYDWLLNIYTNTEKYKYVYRVQWILSETKPLNTPKP
jgi:hypothetical protein